MSESESGICDICKRPKTLLRKYYYFKIPCECCSDMHFEICRYCHECKPQVPLKTKIIIKDINGNDVHLSLLTEYLTLISK